MTRLNERSVWVRKFLKHGTKIASLTPSSKWLCSAMLRDLDPSRPQIILELGSGTGPLTEMVARRMHPESTFLSVEVDKELHEIASSRCPDTDIAHASAEFLPDLLADRNLDQVDVFLSCLPTPSLPQGVNKIVFETLEAHEYQWDLHADHTDSLVVQADVSACLSQGEDGSGDVESSTCGCVSLQ